MFARFIKARQTVAFERNIKKMCARKMEDTLGSISRERSFLQRVAYAIRTI